MLTLPLDTWIRLVVWMIIGLLIYFLYGKEHSVLGKKFPARQPGNRDRVIRSMLMSESRKFKRAYSKGGRAFEPDRILENRDSYES